MPRLFFVSSFDFLLLFNYDSFPSFKQLFHFKCFYMPPEILYETKRIMNK